MVGTVIMNVGTLDAKKHQNFVVQNRNYGTYGCPLCLLNRLHKRGIAIMTR